jgi:hypothetical protein
MLVDNVLKALSEIFERVFKFVETVERFEPIDVDREDIAIENTDDIEDTDPCKSERVERVEN